jgi:uncharacterized RDD family membrane protein YckC
MRHPYQVHRLAPLSLRAAALLVDLLITGALSALVFVGSGWWIGAAASAIIILVYQWFYLVHRAGQTPGKRLLGLRVIRVDGAPLTSADAVLRCLGGYLNTAFFGLGWLWALCDVNQQGWHDKLAHTYVVLVGEP